MTRMGAVGTAGLMMVLAGCFGHPGGEAAANDSQAMSTGQFAVDTSAQLPECDDSTEAYIAYVRDQAHVVKCASGSWNTTHQEIN